MKKIILTGGGTAGHVTPNLSLLPFLAGYEIHYFGSENGIEIELTKDTGVIYHALPVVKFSRSFTPKNLAIPFILAKGVSRAKKLIKEIQPSVIFSKGGYVALPVCLAAGKVPLLVHESDFSMGLANKMSAKKARFTLTSFADLAGGLENGIHTGSPLRSELYFGKKSVAENKCKLYGKRNLLIMGGSSGAESINNMVSTCINELTSYFNIVHITGKNKTSNVLHSGYYQTEYAANIADYFAWADAVVSRGGANSLFELVALAKPSLIIPLPRGNSRGDQEDNARYFEKQGCVNVLLQSEMTPGSFVSAILKLDKDSAVLKENCKRAVNIDGTRKIAQLLIKTAEQQE